MENTRENSSRSFFQKKNQETAIDVLKEAFPDVDEKVVNAVLIASQYSIESSFNALLSISDSNYKAEMPIQTHSENDAISDIMKFHQIENDYKYACYLAQITEAPLNGRRNGYTQHYGSRKENSFSNDELSTIYENIKQGFGNAKTKVSTFFSNIKKRIDNNVSLNEKKSNFSDSSSRRFSRISKTSIEHSDITSFALDEDFVHLNLEDNEKASQGLLSSSCSKNDSMQNLKENKNHTI